MKNLFRELFDIREGEDHRAALMFSYIFLVICSLLIVKPVRNSLFLTHIGIEQLPVAFILVAIVAALVSNIYSSLSKSIRLDQLIISTFFVSIALLFFFRYFLYLKYQQDWFYYALYIWVAIFGVITTSQFWLLANYVFNAREAKRLFGLIGAGGISGGIFGGYLTKFLAPVVGTHNLLLFCILSLSLCSLIAAHIWQLCGKQNYSERFRQQQRLSRKVREDNPYKRLFQSKHFLFLAALVGTGVLVANIVDFQFSAIAGNIIKDEDKLTAFFGFWLSNLSILSLFIQLLLTARILSRFGITPSLFFLPVGIFAGAISILFQPALWSAILVKVSDGSFKQSINKAALELLVVPLPSDIKNQGKAFIDVFVDSLATGLGGVLLLIFTITLGLSVQQISLFVIVMIMLWFYLIVRVKKEYINSFRLALEKRSINLDEQTINIEDASVYNSLVKLLESGNERKILYVLQLIENIQYDRFIPYLRKLLSHPSDEIKLQVLHLIKTYSSKDFSPSVKELLFHDNFDIQVAAMRYLYHQQPDSESLKAYFEYKEISIRTAALMCAAMENRDDKEFRKTGKFKEIFDAYIETDSNSITEPRFRARIAQVIGIARDEELYPFLRNLLRDQNTMVLRGAIIAAGQTRNPVFITLLINHLNTKRVRRYARRALAAYGETIIDQLENCLKESDKDPRIRQEVPKVLALIGTQTSVNTLFKYLDLNDLRIRYEIIRALNRLRINFPILRFDASRVKKRILLETDRYLNTLTLLRLQDRIIGTYENRDMGDKNVKQARYLLNRALEERLEDNLERIFRLLALVYPAKDIHIAYQAIISSQSHVGANAIEFLDNILDPDLKKHIIPIVDRSPTLEKIDEKINRNLHQSFELEAFKRILQSDDNWLKACVLYLMAESLTSEPEWIIKELTSDPDPIVQETARFAVNKIKK